MAWTHGADKQSLSPYASSRLEQPLIGGAWPGGASYCARNHIEPEDLQWAKDTIAELAKAQCYLGLRPQLRAAGTTRALV
jgi:hypothetical protein